MLAGPATLRRLADMKLSLQTLTPPLIALACIAVGVVAMLRLAPPGHRTKMDLERLHFEAEAYRRKQGHCAPTLLELVREPELRNLTSRDEWGRVFAYECRSDGTLRIESLGADGKRGGSGADADLVTEAK
ncbi:MAG TPA: type II secretion system protein GspG [Polyangiales bacterium]|nr:type II secretion system protein GspG [Polyangiales bacterium]